MISFFTNKGHKCDLENLQIGQIEIKEIAKALSHSCRYNGQTRKFYSVAQHCVLLVRYAKKNKLSLTIQKELLVHDGSEAFVGDIVYHLKARLPFFKELEEKVLRKVYYRFGLSFDRADPKVHELDRRICADEMSQLMCEIDPECDKPLGIKIKPWSPAKAYREFMKEYRRLWK